MIHPPSWGSIPTRPRCDPCQRVVIVDFRVSDELWEAVVHPSLRRTYMCIECFASRADEKLIDWAAGIELFPLSLAAQIKINQDMDSAR